LQLFIALRDVVFGETGTKLISPTRAIGRTLAASSAGASERDTTRKEREKEKTRVSCALPRGVNSVGNSQAVDTWSGLMAQCSN
jgi:hypothetical protein